MGATTQQQQERDFMLSRQTLGRPASMGGAGVMVADTAIIGGQGHNHQQHVQMHHQQVSDTLNSRSMQGGATIVTQFNRDNLDETAGNAGGAGYDEIDDLRRA